MIRIQASALAAAMKAAAGVTERRNTIPILQNVLVATVDDNTVEIATTDLNCEYRQRIEAQVEAPFAATVEAHRMASIAGAADGGAMMTLSAEGDDGKAGRLIVKAGRSRFSLPSLPPGDFPQIPFPADLAGTTLDGAALAAAIARVAWSANTEPTRYYMNGALLHGEDGRMALVATNGHTLVQSLMETVWPDGAPEGIVPNKALRLIERLAADRKSVSLTWDAAKLRLTAGPVTFTSKLIDGSFPEFRRVIPAESAALLVDPAALARAANRVTLVSSGKTRAVRLARTDGTITLSTTDPEGGMASEDVPAELQGDAFETGFDAAYLREMLAAIGGDTLEIHHADPVAPAMFRRKVPDGARGVIMPMRV